MSKIYKKKRYSICIWMNIPSHHQEYFFKALHEHGAIDPEVRYYALELLEQRKKCGWILPNLEEYEKISLSPEEILSPRLKKRIHVIAPGGKFTTELAILATRNNLCWCHWSERLELPLATKLGFRNWLWQALCPVYWFYYTRIKPDPYWKLLKTSARLIFAQGVLAQKSLKHWGAAPNKIFPLYYTVAALPHDELDMETLHYAAGKRIFLCCASLEKRKGISILLQAFALLHDVPNWCIVFVGNDHSQGYFQQQAKALGIETKVFFRGTVTSDHIAKVIAAADVFVLPTLFDGWGVVLNEAASLGKPLISTTECGAAWHLIHPGQNGFRVKSNNVSALCNAMRTYIKKPALISEHGQNSLRIFQEFTPEKNVERLLTAFEKSEIEYD